MKSITQIIKNFVKETYGESELKNPSWNIKKLAKAIAMESERLQTKQLYMVVVDFKYNKNRRENLEIWDFDLTHEEALECVKELKTCGYDDLQTNRIKIVPQFDKLNFHN